MKQFCVSWRWNDRDEVVKQTMHMAESSARALSASRAQMYAQRFNVSQMNAKVLEIDIVPAQKGVILKPKVKSTEVDKQGDFWWNKM